MSTRGLVIFDLDGTLFEGRSATLPAVQRAFEELGLAPPTREQVQFYIGKPQQAFHNWLRVQAPDELAGRLVSAVDRYELELVGSAAGLYPGVREALAEIRKLGPRMAICTNGYQGYVERVLAAHGIAPFFDHVRYWRGAGDTKVTMVGELLAELGERPAIVVGDRIDDVEAARRGGVYAIAATYGYGTAEELAQADGMAESPAALPDLVRSFLMGGPVR